ncbi:Response regulator receiver domain-containing protein [Chitinophaga jiangningensis]|uniref:Response regulator receiver domain-containing protein n=1 Tax=Chitinophaga jiangningensis TaxID=1419482 RepID=A0A1M7F887_9BACT|nr:response regulator [Chitinophaga jiangningensis]SHM00261.1 Response regulator receiver domain-containing protein [Chitinophaga jiangningensis]
MTVPDRKTLFLLIDDDDDDAYLFEEVLLQISPHVAFKCVANGKDALELLQAGNSDQPHIIFLDLNMPRMDGRECLMELKKNQQLQHIPVIIYTTSSHPNDIRQTLQNGALSFVTKPTNVKDLESILTTVVNHIDGNLSEALVGLKLSANMLNVVNTSNENGPIGRIQPFTHL